jgi:hypothetical protein
MTQLAQPFNAETFRAEFGRALPSSKYIVIFSNAPKVMTHDGVNGALKAVVNPSWSEKAAGLSFGAIQAELPMRQLDTLERRYNGPVRNVPVGHTYATMNFEFIDSMSKKMRAFFATWQENIFTTANQYGVPYYDAIIVPEVTVKIFGQDGREVERYVIHEVYPINIGSTQLAWANKDQIMTTNVEFSFHRWERIDLGEMKDGESGIEPKYDRSGELGDSRQGRSRDKPYNGMPKNKFGLQDAIDKIRDINNTIKFAKGSFKTAKDLARQARNLRNLKVRNFDDFTKAAGAVGEVARRTTDSVNIFGHGIETTKKKFTTETINKFFE